MNTTPFPGMRALLAVAVIVFLAACSPHQESEAAALPGQLGGAAALVPLYAALGALEDGRRQTVAILQIGDSHTANDSFSGRLREGLQERFGNAGRGLLPPAIPYAYYRPAQVSVSAEGWTVVGSADETAAGPFGLAGLRQAAAGPATLTVTARQPGGMAQAWIEVLARPGGGTLSVTADDATPTVLTTDAPTTGARWLRLPTSATTRTVQIASDGMASAELLAMQLEAGTRGVTYSNLGTIGAQAGLIGRWDPAVIRGEVAQLKPALVVVAFGTNEGFKDSLDIRQYAAAFARNLRALRAMAPGAAFLVAGPPDGVRQVRDGRGTCPRDPDDQREWATPPRLAEVRAVQQREAAAQGAYFWDWSAAMGGTCGTVAWARTVPPKSAPDGVHLFAPGYRETADLLLGEIMRGFQAYRARPR